tara:strand:+ start:52 stop:252 length:201 start_codon:yes stop_codon:yes gene_type:complete
MIEYEVGDMVTTTQNQYIGVVFWKGEPPRSVTYGGNTWYKVLWNDGDITEEDGDDMKLYKEEQSWE